MLCSDVCFPLDHEQVTIFDHRGCARKGVEYKGELVGGQDDEMMVKVQQTQLKIDSPAFKELANVVRAVSICPEWILKFLACSPCIGDLSETRSWERAVYSLQLPSTSKLIELWRGAHQNSCVP